MQPGKTFKAFFKAAKPYIGPMFAPAWQEIEKNEGRNTALMNWPFLQQLHRGACHPFPIVLLGAKGSPFRGICDAINAFSVADARPVQTIDFSPGATRKFIEDFCKAKRPQTYAIGLTDLMHESIESIRGLLAGADLRWRDGTGVRLIVHAPLCENEIPEEWQFFFKTTTPFHKIEIPPISERRSSFLPWVLYYAQKHTTASCQFPNVLPFDFLNVVSLLGVTGGEDGIEFGIRALQPSGFMGEGVESARVLEEAHQQGIAQARTEIVSLASKHLPTKHVTTVQKLVDNVINIPFKEGIASHGGEFSSINPAWLIDMRSGDPYNPNSGVSFFEGLTILAVDCQKALSALRPYIPTIKKPMQNGGSGPEGLQNIEPPGGTFYYTEDCHHVNYDGAWFSPPEDARRILDFIVRQFNRNGNRVVPLEAIAAKLRLRGQTSGGKPLRVDDRLRKTKLWCSRVSPDAVLDRDPVKKGHIVLRRKPVTFPEQSDAPHPE